jgi:hypothetical protein
MLTNVRASAFVLVTATAILFGGCATSAPAVRLNPDAVEVAWDGGHASVRRAGKGVRVKAAYEHQLGGLLAVRVESQAVLGTSVSPAPAGNVAPDSPPADRNAGAAAPVAAGAIDAAGNR